MKKYSEFAELCATLAMDLGKQMGDTLAMITGKVQTTVSKNEIRALCDDQFDENEYVAVKQELLDLVRAAARRRYFGGEVSQYENGEMYVLTFRQGI